MLHIPRQNASFPEYVAGTARPTNLVRNVCSAPMRRLLLVIVAILAGCAHKAAAKVVDPVLLSEGTMIERSSGSRGGFVLGDYTFERTNLDRTPAPNASTGLSPDGLSRPAERLDLQLAMQVQDRRWTGACQALREPTGRQDYAAVTEEFHDMVQIDCTFESGTSSWSFTMKGSLATNLGGTLTPKHREVEGGGLEVEVLMWRDVWGRVRRQIPEPVAQVRLKRSTSAAMILARPEQAWFAPSTPQEILDAAMVTLGALRMLPLGFEG